MTSSPKSAGGRSLSDSRAKFGIRQVAPAAAPPSAATLVCAEIAQHAYDARVLLDKGISRQDWDLIDAAVRLVSLAGWLADEEALRGGESMIFGGADEWLITPRLHEALHVRDGEPE